LLTTGEDGFPSTAFTWVAAVNPTSIRFGADAGSTSLANLQREKRASLQVIARDDLIYLIKGLVSQVKPQIESVPFKIIMMALDIIEVKDQSWPGVTVQPLAYEWATDRHEEMMAMEQAVYRELREWNR
jgi:hypothetical protein